MGFIGQQRNKEASKVLKKDFRLIFYQGMKNRIKIFREKVETKKSKNDEN